MSRHFLDIAAVPAGELRSILDHSGAMKSAQKSGNAPGIGGRPFEGKVLAMIFDKPSTRTRVSFDVGMRQLGGVEGGGGGTKKPIKNVNNIVHSLHIPSIDHL